MTVNFPNGAMVTFDNISSPCRTFLTEIEPPDQSPPANYSFVSGSYYDISTTCSYSGNIMVTLPYNEFNMSGQESALKLFHWLNPGWEDCTVSVDTLNNSVTGQVTLLSPFGIGYYSSGGGGGGGGYSTGANENMIALIAILAISAGIFILRRQQWIKA